MASRCSPTLPARDACVRYPCTRLHSSPTREMLISLSGYWKYLKHIPNSPNLLNSLVCLQSVCHVCPHLLRLAFFSLSDLTFRRVTGGNSSICVLHCPDCGGEGRDWPLHLKDRPHTLCVSMWVGGWEGGGDSSS